MKSITHIALSLLLLSSVSAHAVDAQATTTPPSKWNIGSWLSFAQKEQPIEEGATVKPASVLERMGAKISGTKRAVTDRVRTAGTQIVTTARNTRTSVTNKIHGMLPKSSWTRASNWTKNHFNTIPGGARAGAGISIAVAGTGLLAKQGYDLYHEIKNNNGDYVRKYTPKMIASLAAIIFGGLIAKNGFDACTATAVVQN